MILLSALFRLSASSRRRKEREIERMFTEKASSSSLQRMRWGERLGGCERPYG